MTVSGVESNISRDVGLPDSWQVRPMGEYLIGVDAENGMRIPMLATEWQVEGDGRFIRMKLREGVRFHDGGEFTAKDVAHTAELYWDESSPGGATLFRGALKPQGLQIINEREILIEYVNPDPNWSYWISREYGFDMESKSYFDQNGFPANLSEAPIPATGPYQFKERVQGSKLVYERVSYTHWRVTPDFPELELRFQAEASTRFAALLTGETHLTVINADDIPLAEKEGMKLLLGKVPALRTWLGFTGVYLDNENPGQYVHGDSPLIDVRVRKALNKAIDRDAINTAFFGGRGEVMILNHLHPTREGWNPAWEARWPAEYGFDPTIYTVSQRSVKQGMF